MTLLGKVLLWCGFLSGSLATVYEVKDTHGLGVTIPWYAISIIVIVVGIVMIRIGKTAVANEKASGEESIETLRQSIERLVTASLDLQKSQDDWAPSEMVQQIDDRCAKDFQDFADARKSLIPPHGLSVYAEVMSQFASGERAMNRAWSAAADGYVDEVRICLDRSREHLQATRDILEKLGE